MSSAVISSKVKRRVPVNNYAMPHKRGFASVSSNRHKAVIYKRKATEINSLPNSPTSEKVAKKRTRDKKVPQAASLLFEGF